MWTRHSVHDLNVLGLSPVGITIILRAQATGPHRLLAATSMIDLR